MKKTLLDLMNSRNGVYKEFLKEDVIYVKLIHAYIKCFSDRLKIRIKEGDIAMAKRIEGVLELCEEERNGEMKKILNF